MVLPKPLRSGSDRPLHRPRRGLGLLAALTLLAPLLPGQGREVKLQRAITVEAATTLTPLHVHLAKYSSRIAFHAKREAKLVELEATLAGDLAGFAQGGGEGSKESLRQVWEEGRALYLVLAKAGGVAAWFTDESWNVADLYRRCFQVSQAAAAEAAKRHALEKEYFDLLLTAKTQAGKANPHCWFELGEALRRRIATALRVRLQKVQRLRQETIEHMLLATRDASRYGIPIAAIERGVTWTLTDDSKVAALKAEKKGVEQRIRSLQAGIEQAEGLLVYADKKLAELRGQLAKKPAAAEAAKLAAKVANVQKRRTAIGLRLTAPTKGLRARLAASKAELPKLAARITKAQEEARAEAGGSSKHKANQLAATLSARYTELSIRRRVNARAGTEARHLCALASKLHTGRRNVAKARQKQAVLARGLRDQGVRGDWTKVIAAYRPKDFVDACLELGAVHLIRGELAAEDANLAQMQYFTALSDWYKKREGRVSGSEDHLGKDLLRSFTDEVTWYMGLFSGMATGFFDGVKGVANEAELFRWGTELDKIHNRIRRAREGVKKKVDYLLAGVGKSPAATVRAFGLGGRTPTAYSYRKPKPEHQATALELLKEDRTFHEALGGGLRRIASGLDRTLADRLASEYLVAYDGACLTLRDLMRTEFALKGLDAKSGQFTFKILLSPVGFCKQIFIYFSEKILGEPMEITGWIQRRGKQIASMVALHPKLAGIGFRPSRLAELDADTRRAHLKLHYGHPDYRRFWNKAVQEDLGLAQYRLMKAIGSARNFREREKNRERLAALKASAPSPAVLARASFQDGLDQVLLQNMPKALACFVMANELDWRVLPTSALSFIENDLAWQQTKGDVGSLATRIGDQIVWYLIFQGVTKALPGLGGAKAAAAGEAGAAGATASSMTAKEMLFLAVDKGLASVKFLYGQINPMASLMSYELIKQGGIKALLAQAGSMAVNTLGQEALRDGILVKGMGIDPEVADWLAGALWEVGQAYYEAGSKRLSEEITLFSCAWRLQRTKKRLEQLQAGGAEAGRVAADPEATWYQRLLARRRMLAMGEATTLRARLHRIEDELGGLLQGDGPGGERAAKIKQRLEEAQQVGESLGSIIEPCMDSSIKRLLVEQRLGEKLGSEDPAVVREAAVEAFAKLDPDFLAHHDFSADPEMARLLDRGRRALLFETFDQVRNQGLADPGALLKSLDLSLMEKWSALGIKPQERIKHIIAQIEQIVPTGSAAYEQRERQALNALGRPKDAIEYVPLKSDLDFTVILANGDGSITTRDRAILQALLEVQFRKVCATAAKGRPGGVFHHRQFDIAFMVDTRRKFNAATTEATGPREFIDQVGRAGAADLARYNRELDAANKALDTDMLHDERYVTAGRYRGLGYLTALGEFVMLWDSSKGGYVKRRKVDVMRSGTAEEKAMLQKMVANARLEGWMGIDIMFEDLAFLRVKGKKFKTGADATADDLWAYTKEMDKRAIRVLMGFLATHPEGRRRLNALVDDVMNKGALANHGTICDVAASILAQDPQARARFERAGVADVVGLVREWKERKLGTADIDDQVARRAGVSRDALPDPTSPEYRKALADKVADTNKAMEVMLGDGVAAGKREVRTLVETIDAVRSGRREMPTEALLVLEKKLQYILKTYAVTADRLGPEHLRLLRDTMGSRGADLEGLVKQIAKAKAEAKNRPPDVEPFKFSAGWFLKPDKDAMEEWQRSRGGRKGGKKARQGTGGGR